MKIAKIIERADVIERLKDIARTRPHQRNPSVAGFCVYSDPDGNHCIVGQVLADLGVWVPRCDEVSVDVLALAAVTVDVLALEAEVRARTGEDGWLINTDAIQLLARVQRDADVDHGSSSERPTWGEVVECLSSRGFLDE